MGNCLCVKPATKDEVTTLNTREAPPAHFMIKIESFSVLQKYGIKKYETKEFVTGDYKWRLIFKFNGKDSDYISVNLAMADTTSLPTNWEVNALFSVFLFNQISDNYLSSTGRTRCFQATKSEWGISKFISRKVLSDPSNGYIIDDSCVFGAQVFVVKTEAVIELFSYWFSASSSSWGRPVYIDLATISDPNKGFIVKDCCLLNIEINVKAVARVS
ncbi:hypothetical protein MIMGU_mgv1a023863mg [Erythranthe guttata]|uniref:MATH domain-containing protein n=1 Tax=Erythranthe guttata TaxID=4155 RepID=A0A022QA58_ERYGU|nr:hypothetical protein MIMGU_mgv1a023863mg [Erythranthe guttata]